MKTRTYAVTGIVASFVLVLFACGNDGRRAFEPDETASPSTPPPGATTSGAEAGPAPEAGRGKPGVGYPPGSCNPFTCKNGCCAPDGTCMAGKEPSRCGKGGLACMDCAAMGFGCTDQGCNPTATCAGCGGCCKAGSCNENGKTQDNACGKNGDLCIDCTSSGRTCNGNGLCQ